MCVFLCMCVLCVCDPYFSTFHFGSNDIFCCNLYASLPLSSSPPFPWCSPSLSLTSPLLSPMLFAIMTRGKEGLCFGIVFSIHYRSADEIRSDLSYVARIAAKLCSFLMTALNNMPLSHLEYHPPPRQDGVLCTGTPIIVKYPLVPVTGLACMPGVGEA